MKKMLVSFVVILNLMLLTGCKDEPEPEPIPIQFIPINQVQPTIVKETNSALDTKVEKMYNDYATFNQTTEDISSNPYDALVSIYVGNGAGTGVIVDCVDDTTYILSAVHIFRYLDIPEDNIINLKMWFNNSEEYSFEAKFTRLAKYDACVLAINFDITEFESIAATDLTVDGNFDNKTTLKEYNYNNGYTTYDFSLSKIMEIELSPSPTTDLKTLTTLLRYEYYHDMELKDLHGASGSGIFSDNGIMLGMVISANDEYLTAIPIRTLVKTMNEENVKSFRFPTE